MPKPPTVSPKPKPKRLVPPRRTSPTKTPANLARPGQQLFRHLADEYGIVDTAGVALLEVAARALDRLRQAEGVLRAEGLTVQGKDGPRAHPALAVEVSARAGLLATLKALRLDLEPLKDRDGRPPNPF
jgi:hypothetical protein